MRLTIDTWIILYTVVVIFWTGIVMFTRVNRREPTDYLFTVERFSWGVVWTILGTLITFRLPSQQVSRDLVLTARYLLAGMSTIILVWILLIGRYHYDGYPHYTSRIWRYIRSLFNRDRSEGA